MLESFSEVPVLLVPVDDMHFQGQAHIIKSVLGTAVVLVSPVEVETFDLVLIVQGSSEDVGQTEAFLFFFGAVFGDGEGHWKNRGIVLYVLGFEVELSISMNGVIKVLNLIKSG